MDFVLLGVIIGSVLILCLIRGLGLFSARTAARNAYREGMNAELTNRRSHSRVTEPRRPEQVYISGENRFERSPDMEAPPVYFKDDRLPAYGEVVSSYGSSSAPQTSAH